MMQTNKNAGPILSLLVLTFCSFNPVLCQGLNKRELLDNQSAKNANLAEAEKLNGTSKTQSHKVLDKNKQNAQDLAGVVNQVPGVKVQAKDLEPPTQMPIKGFHPIKKLLRPVENLEGMSIKLEQQIMKLEGPIAALQPPMIHLQQRMVNVDSQIEKMQSQLNSVQGQVAGVRSELSDMRNQIGQLESPIRSIQKPLSGVAKPLEAVQTQLNLILLCILVAAAAIAVGTPIAAILIYKHRHRLFPDLQDHELPAVAQVPDTVSIASKQRN